MCSKRGSLASLDCDIPIGGTRQPLATPVGERQPAMSETANKEVSKEVVESDKRGDPTAGRLFDLFYWREGGGEDN